MEITVVWNTFIIQAGNNPSLVTLYNDGMDSATATIANNIIVGTSNPYEVSNPDKLNWLVRGSNNCMDPTANTGVLTNTVFDSNLVAESDLVLTASSPCLNAADLSIGNLPRFEYSNMRKDAKDIGAHDY